VQDIHEVSNLVSTRKRRRSASLIDDEFDTPKRCAVRPRRASIEACPDDAFHRRGEISTQEMIKKDNMVDGKKASCHRSANACKRDVYEHHTKQDKDSIRKTRARRQPAEIVPGIKAQSSSYGIFSVREKVMSTEDLLRFNALFKAAEFFTECDKDLLKDVEDILPSLQLLKRRTFQKDDFMKSRKKPSTLSLMR